MSNLYTKQKLSEHQKSLNISNDVYAKIHIVQRDRALWKEATTYFGNSHGAVHLWGVAKKASRNHFFVSDFQDFFSGTFSLICDLSNLKGSSIFHHHINTCMPRVNNFASYWQSYFFTYSEKSLKSLILVKSK